MKRYLFVVLVLTLSLSANSQLDKGVWLVGGSGSFYSYDQRYTSPTNTTNAEYTSIDLSASVGYFLMDKLAAGLRPGFSSFKGEVANQGFVSGTTKYSVGPFARYYFLKTDKQFNLLTDISYQLGFTKEPIGEKSKGNFNSFTFLAGPEVFFNSSVGLEVLLGYRKARETLDKPTFKYKDNRSGFLVSVGFQFHLENN